LPSLGRFLTRDTWGGDANSPMSFNRWMYTEGNPVNRIDPSGLSWISDLYGLDFLGKWAEADRNLAEWAVILVGFRMTETLHRNYGDSYGSMYEEARIFRAAYGIKNNDLMTFKWNPQCYGCRPVECQRANLWNNKDPEKCECEKTNTCNCKPIFGVTNGVRDIEFASMSKHNNIDIRNLRKTNNVIHELGHAFNVRLGRIPENAVASYSVVIDNKSWSLVSRPDGFYRDNTGDFTWVQSPYPTSTEIFADMFLGWIYNKWANDPYGKERAKFMDDHMKVWIENAMRKTAP